MIFTFLVVRLNADGVSPTKPRNLWNLWNLWFLF